MPQLSIAANVLHLGVGNKTFAYGNGKTVR